MRTSQSPSMPIVGQWGVTGDSHVAAFGTQWLHVLRKWKASERARMLVLGWRLVVESGVRVGARGSCRVGVGAGRDCDGVVLTLLRLLALSAS